MHNLFAEVEVTQFLDILSYEIIFLNIEMTGMMDKLTNASELGQCTQIHVIQGLENLKFRTIQAPSKLPRIPCKDVKVPTKYNRGGITSNLC